MDTARAGKDVASTLVGCVATNQTRKELGLWAEVGARLVEETRGNVRLWLHVDTPVRHWNVHALVADFALGEYVEVTGPPVDDTWLAAKYRACTITFLPSSGEGFGYPLFESLACGTPVVTGSYAGGGSLMAAFGLAHLLVPPVAWRLEGVHNCMRPVYRAEDFVTTILQAMEQHRAMEISREAVAACVAHLDMMRLGKTWKKWLREGLA